MELQDIVPVDQVIDEGFQVLRPRICGSRCSLGEMLPTSIDAEGSGSRP